MTRILYRNPRLRFIVEPDDGAEGGGGAEPQTSATEAPQEGAEEHGKETGDEFDSTKALEKIRKLNSEAINLRKRAKDAEEKAAGADQSTQQAQALAAENLRLKVGLKHGLPEAIIDRLKGENEEELLADAEQLLALLSPKAPPSNRPRIALKGGADPTAEPDETDVSKLGARMFRR